MLFVLLLLGSTDGSLNIRHEESTLEAAVKELTRARIKMKVHLLRSQQDVKRRLDRANILATTGGSPGESYITRLARFTEQFEVHLTADPGFASLKPSSARAQLFKTNYTTTSL